MITIIITALKTKAKLLNKILTNKITPIAIKIDSQSGKAIFFGCFITN